jgi:hypothetical protein
MTGFKYIAGVLTLVGAVNSAQATGEVSKDQIQFMNDQSLTEIQGAAFGTIAPRPPLPSTSTTIERRLGELARKESPKMRTSSTPNRKRKK